MDGRLGDEKSDGVPAVVPGPASRLASRYVGEVLSGTYRIARRIGSGGMADVYEVEHLRLGSRFAAKVLRPREGAEGSVRRFLREARLLAGLRSDHIVTVFDVSGPDEEGPFYVMELLHGSDLRKLLSASPELSVARAVKIICDACLGVSAAHAAGLVHRDLKPENLFVTHRDSGEELCKLLDFGVAKADGGTSTEHGALIGTVRYMAPEQIAHAGTVSPRADVRGLGAILYECLAGRAPHVADSLERLLFQVLNEPVLPIRGHRSAVPSELDDIVLRALARDPADRFQSAAAFAEALAPFAASSSAGLDAEATARTSSNAPARRVPGSARRRARPWMLVGTFAAGAAAGAACFQAVGRRDSRVAVPAPSFANAPRELVPVASVVGAATPAPVMKTQTLALTASDERVVAGVEPVVRPSLAKPASSKLERRPSTSSPAASAPAKPEESPVTPRVRIESRNPYAPEDVGTTRFGNE